MASKYTDFFDSSRSSKSNREDKFETSKKESPKFEDRYALPEDIKRKEDIKKEFKDYLAQKEEGFDRGYVPPPFEASKVPSPYYGYKKPKAAKKKTYDYNQLKNKLSKKDSEFIILETFATSELKSAWAKENTKGQSNQKHSEKKQHKTNSFNRPTREKAGRTHGLHRTLESIMDEEQSGNNNSKRNVPGYFNNK